MAGTKGDRAPKRLSREAAAPADGEWDPYEEDLEDYLRRGEPDQGAPHEREEFWHPARLYHGTSAELRPGDVVEPGHPGHHPDTYDRRRQYAYATPHLSEAAGYAEAAAVSQGGHPRVYEVSHAGDMMPDPEQGVGIGVDSQAFSQPGWRSKTGFPVTRELHPREFSEHFYHDWPELRSRTAAARWQPSSGIFGPTTGLDGRLFGGDGELRPEVREAIMARLDQALRVDAGITGSDWQQWARVYLAGGSASEWAGDRPNGTAQDLDVLLGVDYGAARAHSAALSRMDDAQVDAALNAALRSGFNETGWMTDFGGPWDLTGYVNHAAFDVRAIKPYAAYDVSRGRWAVRPPHLPAHSLADFDPAVLAQARALASEARAILRMPEPLRTREARSLWERVHAERSQAFSGAGQGWTDPGNVAEKWLAYAPGNLLGRVRELALGKTAAVTVAGPLYHGSLDRFPEGSVLTPEGKRPGGSSFSGDYVYATTSPEAARYFGSMHDDSPMSDRDVYVHRVEPVGALEPDEFPAGAEDERYAEGNYRAKALRVLDSRRMPGHWASKAAVASSPDGMESETDTAFLAKVGAMGDEGEAAPWHQGMTFYHGTRAPLREGQQLTPGHHPSPYGEAGAPLPYVFFTTDRGEADRWARSSRHSGNGLPRVYEVHPGGEVIPDRGARASYMSPHPVTVGRRVPWGVGMQMQRDDTRNAGTSRVTQVPAVEERFRARGARVAAHVPEDEPAVRDAGDLGWGPQEWATARREPWHAAAWLAQREVRLSHPKATMEFPRGDEADRMVGHLLRYAGYPEHRLGGAFAVPHRHPEQGNSNPAWDADGFPGVALHPDRWDYGTAAHEAAHHVVLYNNGRGPNTPQTDEQVHGPEWAGHYALALNRISRHAGDDFLHHHQRFHAMIAGGLRDQDPAVLDAAERRLPPSRWIREGAAEKPSRAKAQVNYRPAEDDRKRCGTCTMIRLNPPDFESHSCTLVKGLIDPGYVCDEWYPADGSTKEAAALEREADDPTPVGGQPRSTGWSWDPAPQPRGGGYDSRPLWQRQDSAVEDYLLRRGQHEDETPEEHAARRRDIERYGPARRKDQRDKRVLERYRDRALNGGPIGPDPYAPRYDPEDIDRDSPIDWGHEVIRPEAASGYSGLTGRSAMIYLDLPEGAVRRVRGGVDDHHVTVVYLGKNVSDKDYAEACRRAAEAAAVTAPLSGFLGGIETFEPSDSSDGKVPAFVPVYLPGIGALRKMLEDLSGSEHRQYRPHVTLGYYDEGEELPEPHPNVPVAFSRLHVKRGDDVTSYPLGPGHAAVTASVAEPRYYHGSGKRYQPGDLIDPAAPHKKIHPQSDPSKAYFSDSPWNAQRWGDVAAASGRGYAYEVEPTGEHEGDPHYSGDDERGIYDLSASPPRRVNVRQTGEPLRVIRRLPRQD